MSKGKQGPRRPPSPQNPGDCFPSGSGSMAVIETRRGLPTRRCFANLTTLTVRNPTSLSGPRRPSRGRPTGEGRPMCSTSSIGARVAAAVPLLVLTILGCRGATAPTPPGTGETAAPALRAAGRETIDALKLLGFPDSFAYTWEGGRVGGFVQFDGPRKVDIGAMADQLTETLKNMAKAKGLTFDTTRTSGIVLFTIRPVQGSATVRKCRLGLMISGRRRTVGIGVRPRRAMPGRSRTTAVPAWGGVRSRSSCPTASGRKSSSSSSGRRLRPAGEGGDGRDLLGLVAVEGPSRPTPEGSDNLSRLRPGASVERRDCLPDRAILRSLREVEGRLLPPTPDAKG